MENFEIFTVITGTASIISLIVSLIAIKKVINIQKSFNVDISQKKKQKAWGIGNKQKMK